MTPKTLQFVRLVIDGQGIEDAYREAYGKADEAAAARLARRAEVRKAIADGESARSGDAHDLGCWSARASDLARIADLRLIQWEIERRKEGLGMVLCGIEGDATMSPEEKLVQRGEAMMRPIVDARLISAKQAIYRDLDARSRSGGNVAADCLAARLMEITATAFADVNPDDYTAPIPATARLVADGKE